MVRPRKPGEAAADWFAKAEDDRMAAGERRAFDAWMADADNARAYHDVEEAWDVLGEAGGDRELLRMRSAALRAASGPSRRAVFGMAGAAIAAAGAGGAGLMMAGAAQATIRTGVGERLTAPLPDGSRVTLAPLSKIRVRFTSKVRAVRLDEGQAYFEARRASDRPFRVTAGDQIAESAGGRFQVTLGEGGSQILLEEGALQVATAEGATARRVAAGQVLSGPAATPRVTAADVDGLTAWRSGRLVFDDEALSDVVAAFNRYSADQLVLARPELGAIRVSGSFRYDGAREFAGAMQAAFGLSVRQVGDATWEIRSGERG
ncbi:FecR family protein [Caulobacter endophyticus]|uniref:FecR family protein n=1 Tax=Caulobacter endophyticus TaxID=2172652 RepID=UPI00240F5807|nr:FecR domain-containing protein [Caulobacter endophyticus]MDG2529918.1 FecR domain-containing protein [Caulobacter endophyticus]